jgi:ATP-dependent helicase/nuclease subunit A
MVLSEQIAVLDLIALGNFVLLPEDDLNLAALLKSPIAGFGEDDLFDLAQPRTGSLWDELCARAGERETFREAHGILSRALSDADQSPPFEFYSRILNRGIRKRLVARMGLETADAIDEFLALALAHEGAHSPSLQSFLHWFGEGGGDVKRDMEQGGGAVRVMTVHGAKGLEAKVVILPDTVQIPDHERRGNILFTENCALFGMPKHLECDLLNAARADAHAQELREYRRLLYVAATRARDLLVVCGYLARNRKEPPPESWHALIRRGATKLALPEEIDGETVLVIGADFEHENPVAEKTSLGLRRQNAPLRCCNHPAPLPPKSPHRFHPWPEDRNAFDEACFCTRCSPACPLCKPAIGNERVKPG